jgi:endonuclease G
MLVSQNLIQQSVSRQPDLDKLIADVSGKNPAEFETPALMAQRENVLNKQKAEPPDFALERLIGKSDLLPFNYLQKGLDAGRAVGRILVMDGGGGILAYGTGFMISPKLMMTNKHVLPATDDARPSQIEFGYELDNSGNERTTVTFDLDPTHFFYADPNFDFSIVAVKPTDNSGMHQLDDYGFLVLNPEKGKVVLGEYLSIIQHPDGREKQIAIRENQVVDHTGDDDYIWYKTDTAPGSSGSPVFNDQWQLVALHHMGVPETNANGDYLTITGEVISKNAPEIDADKLQWKANEGIRVSRIVSILQQAKPDDTLIQTVLNTSAQAQVGQSPTIAAESEPIISTPKPIAMETNNSLTFTVPLNITVSLGATPQAVPVTPAPMLPDTEEAKLVIDPDYTNRKGFDKQFLGTLVDLPKINADRKGEMTPVKTTNDNILLYNHFSVVMNRPRRMAWFTAVNIDSVSWAKLKDQIPARKDIGADTWYLDPRLDDTDQIHKEFYKGNDFDIGHQVRREDPVWGPTLEFAIKCNNDTFHLANACPQHKEFNQGTGPADPGDTTSGKTLWQGLENYILDNAHQNGLNVNVFTGPVLKDTDQVFQNTGIKIPEAFWKVVVLQKSSGGLSATAYLVSQASLIEKMMEDFVFGKYRTYQVAVKHIEDLTGLSFGLSAYDPLDHLPLNVNEALEVEKGPKIKVLKTVHDIIF